MKGKEITLLNVNGNSIAFIAINWQNSYIWCPNKMCDLPAEPQAVFRICDRSNRVMCTATLTLLNILQKEK